MNPQDMPPEFRAMVAEEYHYRRMMLRLHPLRIGLAMFSFMLAWGYVKLEAGFYERPSAIS